MLGGQVEILLLGLLSPATHRRQQVCLYEPRFERCRRPNLGLFRRLRKFDVVQDPEETPSAHVGAEVFVDLLQRLAVDLLERRIRRVTSHEAADKLGKLLPRVSLRERKHVNQRQALRVENAGTLFLVVMRRVVVYGSQRRDVEPFVVQQSLLVARMKGADLCFLADRLKSRVQHGKPFVEPGRKVHAGVPNQQVDVLVDSGHVPVGGEAAHHDVVALAGWHIVGRCELIWLERLVLLLGTKTDDANRELRPLLALEDLKEEAADGFEVQDGFAGALLSGAGVQLEVGRCGTNPLLLRPQGCRYHQDGDQAHPKPDGNGAAVLAPKQTVLPLDGFFHCEIRVTLT